jgi:hypothetical protein
MAILQLQSESDLNLKLFGAMTAGFVIVSKLLIGVDVMLMFVFKVVLELFAKTETIFQLPEVFFLKGDHPPYNCKADGLKIKNISYL